MIIKFHKNTEISPSTGESSTSYRINQCSILRVKNNNPVIIDKIVKKNSGNTIQLFSNYLIENGAVNKFIHYKSYTDAEALWQPSSTNKYYSSYVFSSDLSGNLITEPQSKPVRPNLLDYILVNDYVKPNVYVGKFGVSSTVNDPFMGEWPSPVLLRTGSGTIIKFSKSTSFDNSDIVYTHDCGSNGITFVYNLIPGVKYYYKVYNSAGNPILNIYQDNANYGSFTTEGTTRFIKFKHIRNSRDIGGCITTDSKRLKYGIIYRGSLLDSLGYDSNKNVVNTAPYYVSIPANNSSEDKAEFLKLGITLELDLRDNLGTYQPGYNTTTTNISYSGTSTMGSNINYFKIKGSVASYNTMASGDGIKLFMGYLKKLIDNVNSGGVTYVHCLLGRDRTGTFIAVLEALCGVKSDYVIKDYELTSLWGNGTTRYDFQKNKTWLAFQTLVDGNTSTTRTILSIAERWFNQCYNNSTYGVNTSDYRIKNGSGVEITDASTALTYIKSVLLEDADSEPTPVTPTPADLFVSYNYRPSESASNLVYTTPSTWKFYEILVNQGDTITITLDSPTNVVAVESANGLSSRLANGTSNITSGWTNWDFHYHDVSSDYTVLNDGYLLLIVSTSRTAIISHNSSSQPDVTPTITCNFINSNSIPHSMTGDALTYIAPNEAVELGGNSERPNVAHKWTYGEIPVTSGDVVRVGLNTIDVFNWEAFVESANGLLSSIANNTKVTFDSTQAHRVTSKETGKVWDTISTGHYLYYGEHTVSSTGKLLIGVRIWNDGDPNTITPATYNGIIVKINGTSVPVTWYS